MQDGAASAKSRFADCLSMTDGHFRAFSFVDRITAIQPGVSVRGAYQIPAGITEFASSLVVEAIGQLAAWAAMAALDFKVRPVAGLAGKVEFLAAVYPGQTLELSAEIETADIDAVSYAGSASVGGKVVLRLHDCVGPMMPLEEFDDPLAVRARFELLQADGATAGCFGGVPTIELEANGGESGKSVAATIPVPAAALFFSDHFPRRPVFPGTLLMNLNLQLATALSAEIALPVGHFWQLKSVSDVKLRAFILPGEQLQAVAKLDEQKEDEITIAVETRRDKKLVGGAYVQFVKEVLP